MTENSAVKSPAVARGGALNLAAAVCQQAAMFVTTTIIARQLGQAALGAYSIVYASLSLLSLVSLFGFKAALTRYVAVHLAHDEGGRVRSLLRLVARTWLPVTLALSVIVILFSGSIASAFSGAGMRTGFVTVGICLIPFGVRDLCLAAVQGWRTQRSFALVGWIFEPLVRLGLTAVLVAMGLGLDGSYIALTVGAWLAAVLAVIALARRLRKLPPRQPYEQTREVMHYGFASWGTTLASTGLIWADTLLLGALADAGAVGVYTVATRLVTLAVFVMAPINALFAPHFAHLHAVHDGPGLKASYASATNWILRLALPAFVVLIVFPKPLLDIFGPGFREGATVTVILAAGQLINAATGPCGTLLNMSGHVRLNLINNVVTLALNIGLNLWLIPLYGIVGSAIAWALSLSVVNLVRLAQVSRVLGIHPFAPESAKAFISAGVAAFAGVLWSHLTPSNSGTVIAGIAICGLTYCTATLALRFSREERETISGLVTRMPSSGRRR